MDNLVLGQRILVLLRCATCLAGRCCGAPWCWGEAVLPPLLLPALLMLHMLLFLLPRLDGEPGGVWNVTPPSPALMSVSTWSLQCSASSTLVSCKI